jgi:hypothetical protein
MESPLVFYTQILGSSTHYSISSPGAQGQDHIITRGLQRKIQAIRALRARIEQYKPGSSEVDQGLLLAIFILAIHGNFDLTDKPSPHPLSPTMQYPPAVRTHLPYSKKNISPYKMQFFNHMWKIHQK